MDDADRAARPPWSNSSKEVKDSRCLRVYAPFEFYLFIYFYLVDPSGTS